MRILQLKTSTVRGGAETIVWLFTRAALARGHEVSTIFSEPGWLADAFTEAGFPLRMMPLSSAGGVSQIPALVGAMREYDPDVVLCHGARVNLFGACAARVAGIPSVSVEHNVDDWRESFSMNAVDRICAGWNSHRIAVSRAVRHMLLEKFIVPEAKVTFIPNATDLSASRNPLPRAEVRQLFGLREDDFVAVVVARLVEQKGHRYLFEALREVAGDYPRLKVLLLGDGALRDDLRTMACSLGIGERVLFAGSVPEVPRLLPAFDLFVLPSLWEGMPVALIEAMAAGLPVLATRVAGTPEVITHAETGVLVEPQDSHALAVALRWLQDDPALRARLALAGQEHARQEYDIERMVDRYITVLESVTKEARLAA